VEDYLKAHTDKKQRLLRMESGIKTGASDQTYTGVLNDRLRTMTDVESSPLMLDHTFPTKEVLLLRITEEANLSGCHVSSKRSDDYRVQVLGSSYSSFKIKAVYSSTFGWKIIKCETRHELLSQEETTALDGGVEEIHNYGSDVLGDDNGCADEDTHNNCARTPIKLRWILPFINVEMGEMPNMSNREMKNLTAAYVKDKFMTLSLLQNAKTFARKIIFGDPSTNAFFANALVDKMKDGGHDVMVVTKGCLEVLMMLEPVVLSDKMRKNKATGKLMTRQEKIDYVTKWKIKNKHILKEGGLLTPKRGDAALHTSPLKFLCGIFFSTSAAQEVVPHLQRVFQADACHMNFGKYTLYSYYGTTANCNTFPVAFAIIFGNKDKNGWVQFWKFSKSLHLSLDRFDTTIITNQAKGLREAIYQVLPNAVHFHCSFHRRQNIAKIVKGGECEILLSLVVQQAGKGPHTARN
jgi:hypothetical protein